MTDVALLWLLVEQLSQRLPNWAEWVETLVQLVPWCERSGDRWTEDTGVELDLAHWLSVPSWLAPVQLCQTTS